VDRRFITFGLKLLEIISAPVFKKGRVLKTESTRNAVRKKEVSEKRDPCLCLYGVRGFYPTIPIAHLNSIVI
jgi:hypothetical protein